MRIISLNIILSLTSISFCILAVFVLCYYINRRRLLARDMKNIPKDALIIPDFQNKMKNYKIKMMITHFIIIIIIVEILFNFSLSMVSFQAWNRLLINTDSTLFYKITVKTCGYILNIGYNCHISILCLLLKVLWLTYYHSSCKETIIKWSCVIALRCVVLVLFLYFAKPDYPKHELIEEIIQNVYRGLFALGLVIDLITYITYSIRFYRHLRAREEEARMFKCRSDYLFEKSIRRQFTKATIIVTIAIFFLTVPYVSNFVVAVLKVINVPHHIIHKYIPVSLPYTADHVGRIMYSIITNINYLGLSVLIINQSCIKIRVRKLNNINDEIKPILAKYHKRYERYQNYSSNYHCYIDP